MERSKVVTIGSERYRVDKMTARNACWIVTQLMTKTMPGSFEAALSEGAGIQSGTLPENRVEMSEQEFHNIQDHCLKVCYQLVTQPGSGVEAAFPVMTAQGTWAVPELEHDATKILILSMHALTFSVAPFFTGDVLKQAFESLSELSLFSTSK